MYLGAQRVIGEGDEPSVSLYLYAHSAGVPTAQQSMLCDIRWVSQLAPGQLVRERHEASAGGRRVVSYLELSGPDETDVESLHETLTALETHVAAGNKDPIVYEEWGAELFCGADVKRPAIEELADLRAKLEAFFADGEMTPPKRELTILVGHEGDVTRFHWDEASRTRLVQSAPNWTPAGLSIHADVSEAFQDRYGALFPHVLDIIRPDSEVDLDAMGGVVFKEMVTQRVLWFSPTPRM